MGPSTITPGGGRLMTVEEVSKFLRRSKASLTRDIRNRRFDIVRIGRSVRVPQQSVEKLIARGLVEAK